MTTIVIVCDHAYVSGGLAKVALASAVGLARRGHRVVLFTAVGPAAPELQTAGVELVCLGQSDLLGSPNRLEAAVRALWNRKAARKLTEVIDACPPDDTVLHIHGWAKALSPSVVRACRDSGRPVFFTLHDYFAVCPNGAFFNFQTGRNCPLAANTPACIATHCDARAYPHKLWRAVRHGVAAARGALTGGMTLVTLSPHQLSVIRPHLRPGTPLVHVPNPVEVQDLGPAAVAANRSFLFVGRLSREKGPVLLAEAAAKLGVPTRFVGDGGEREAVLRAQPGAVLSGWLPPEEVIGAIRGARALVLPSVWYETFGLVVYEALANGVPVIVSDNTAAVDAVVHGKTGFVFRSGDAADLQARMAALCDDALAVRLGDAAYRRYWRDPFTLDRHLDRLVEVYDLALGHTALRPPAERAVS
jgi:glycosyltransferase involved in cell wall biosynthesis